MHSALRRPHPASPVVTLPLNSPNNHSFADSAAAKRFTRTKNSEEPTRTRKLSKAYDSAREDQRAENREAVRTAKQAKFVFRPEDLFLRIEETPSKKERFQGPASSDRTTDASLLPELHDRDHSFLTAECLPTREFLTEFREELELKNGEVVLLEDEVLRLRRALQAKEDEHRKEVARLTREAQQEVEGLREEVGRLKEALQARESSLREQKQNENALQREIKSLKYDKTILEKQLEELYKKKLPKEVKDLMSYREQSLALQLEDLRERLQQSKTDQEAHLEEEVLRLKQQNTAAAGTLNLLSAHSHVLTKKLTEREAYLREKTENFGRCYSTLKENHSAVLDQLKQARKENLKLRRLHAPRGNSRAKLAHSSSEESLTFSLASNN